MAVRLAALDSIEAMMRGAMAEAGDRLLVIGLCGAQGSGKSTLAEELRRGLMANGIAVALLSLDDIYLTLAERAVLAQGVHPLLRTRGVPGTHDVALGLRVIEALERGEAAPLPRFDKAADDRLPEGSWDRAPNGTRLLILEGWCVGARPQPQAALTRPVNALEREEDPRGIWRGFVNHALAGDYQRLFARLDRLVMLEAPGFGIVRKWRTQQERALRQGDGGVGVMSDAQVARFIQHYERLTRHMLDEMPDRADMVIALDEARRVTVVRVNRS